MNGFDIFVILSLIGLVMLMIAMASG